MPFMVENILEMAILSLDGLEIVGVLTVLCAALAYYYLKILVPFKNFPSHRFELKILNCIIWKKSLNRIFFQQLTKILQCHASDGICVIWFFKPYVFIFNEEATKLLLNDPDAVEKPSEYKQVDFCLKNAVFTCNGEKWKRMRAFSSRAFQMPVIRDNIGIYNAYSEKLVQQLKIAKPEETTKCLKENFVRAFIESIYGLKADGAENEAKIGFILDSVEKLSKFTAERILNPWLYWDFMLHVFPSARKNLKLYDEVMCTSRKGLNEVKEEIIESRHSESGIPYKPKSVAEVLIDHHIKDPSFTFDDVLHQINAFFAGNSDGVSFSALWCLFLLGHHPDIQEKAFEEVTSATENDIAFEELRNLKYLDCIIKEALRLYPTVPMFARQTKKEYPCGKYKIPEDTTVVIIPYILHRIPDVFHDPEKFDPDRFMEPNSKINDGNYVPFAEGIRSCLGKNFVLMATKVFLCHLIRNFEIISLDRREDLELSWDIVLTPSKDLTIKFVPRKQRY